MLSIFLCPVLAFGVQSACSCRLLELQSRVRFTFVMRIELGQALGVSQGLQSDPTILDTSEVELVDIKFLEDDPVVVVQFTCQQINCSRDKFGNVVEGRPDDVQRVYYYWALAMEHGGFVGSDGKHYPPRWQLKEMMVRGMHNLL